VISIERQARVAKSLSNVYKLSVKQGEKIIKSFLEGITMTLAVETENVGQLADIKIRNWNGQKWELIGGEYADGKVTTAINQPGTFAAFEHTDEKNVAGDSKNGNGVLPETATNLINLMVTGFLLLLAASILLVAYRRRKFGLDSK
jgi:LPXTG-motif cell wall-anchored protein